MNNDKFGYRGFDIETTGLIALDYELVSACIGDTCIIRDLKMDERDLIHNMNALDLKKTCLLTYMGGTQYSPGFDFPFMRTRCAILGEQCPFSDTPHVDIMPILQKRFDLSISYWPTLEDLKVEDLKKVITFFGIDAKPKKKQDYIDTISTLIPYDEIEIHIQESGVFERKNMQVRSLKDTYELLTGEDPGDMRGDQVPLLWRQFIETHDSTILDTIREYNKADCKKVEVLWELIQNSCPARDAIPEIL